jgi:hypothetical protein
VRQPVFVALIVLGLLIHVAAVLVPGAEAARLGGWPLFDPELPGRLQHAIEPWAGAGLVASALKIPGVLFNALVATVAYRATLQRTNDPPVARWAFLACWLNPALILGGDVLGFTDLWAAAVALIALLLAHAGAYFAAGVFAACAALTLPHAVMLVPPVLAAGLTLRGDSGALRVLSGLAAGGTALLAPVAAHGGVATIRNTVRLWLPRAEGSDTVRTAWTAAAWLGQRLPWPKVPRLPQFRGRQRLTSRVIGVAVSLLVLVRGGWQSLQTRALAVHAASGALIVQTVVTLVPGLPVHTQSLAIAPLALGAALRPRLRAVFYALTILVAVSLAASHPGLWPYAGRLVQRADAWAGPILGLANLVVLIWLASQLGTEAYARPRTYV